MPFRKTASKCVHSLRIALVGITVFQFSLGGPLVGSLQAHDHDTGSTDSPVKHVIVLIGENRTFDHLFATYVPKHGETVSNLLSKGIIKADGTPGPHFKKAQQFLAVAPFKTDYYISLDNDDKAPYTTLPAPTLNFSPSPSAGEPFSFGLAPALLGAIEPSLEAADLPLLQTGSSGQANTVVLTPVPDSDTRVANFNNLLNGPFPLKGANLPYDSYTGDTTHRLFEMWQQSDCNIRNATRQNPSGCLSDLYPFVITNYTNQIDSVFDNPPAIDDNGGGNSMAFYNMQTGDVPVLKRLADEFSMSDNFHQSFMGGTGANHVMLGSGDAIFWTDSKGNPSAPPAAVLANPNPVPGTDDVYTVDLLFNGNFTNCADSSQPGIDPIRDYLASLPYHPNPNCEKGHFYMVNNDSPGFLPDGTVDTEGIKSGGSIPPSNVRTIGEALNEKGISWAYYGGAYTAAVNRQHDPKSTESTVQVGQTYCNICNFESYSSAIMGDPAQSVAHGKDAIDFFNVVDNGTLPAVSFVKPDGLLDGHPAVPLLFSRFRRAPCDSVRRLHPGCRA